MTTERNSQGRISNQGSNPLEMLSMVRIVAEEQLVRALGRYQDEDRARGHLPAVEAALGSWSFRNKIYTDFLNRLSPDQRAELEQELEPRTREVRQRIQAELDRISADEGLRVKFKKYFSTVELDALLASAGKSRRNQTQWSDTDDPDFFASCLRDLEDENPFERHAALDRLAKADPREADKELRKKIARSIRDIAVGDNRLDRPKAVPALVVWGGKYSVPILLEMLNDPAGRLSSEEVFKGLAKYPTEESANVVVRYLGDFHTHKHAVECLRQMGPTAESALIAAAPANNPDISLSAIQLLGEVGTKRCLSLLQKAKRSRNPRVQAAANAAMVKVRRRTSGANNT